MPISLKRQIFKRIFLIFLVITLLYGIILFLFERNRYQHSMESIKISLEALVGTKVNSIGNQVFFQNPRGLESSLKTLLNYHGMLGTEIYDPEGNLFFSSYNIDHPPSSPSQISGHQLPLVGVGRLGNNQVMIYTVPLNVAGDYHGFAKFYYNLNEIYNQIVVAALLFSSLISTLFLGTVLISTLILKSKVVTPLSRLATVMQAVGAGELGKQIHIKSENEIGIIAYEFNKMSSENAEMMERLKDINASLENQVVLRTEELIKSQSLLESVLNSSHDGIMVLKSIKNDHGEIEDFEWLMANPKASANFATDVSEIIGKKILTRHPSLKKEEIYNDLLLAADTGTPLIKEIYYEFENIRGWYNVSIMIINEGLAVTFHDITQSKLLQINLEKQANQDGLTGIANRKYFDTYIRQQWDECLLEKENLILLFIDVDYFKRYNDTYGHGKGDQCLKIIAGILDKCASRNLDCAARYGGEEFVLILPRTNRKGGLKVIHQIQEHLVAKAIIHDQSDVSQYVTLSIGMCIARPSKTGKIEDFINAADSALYKAKEQGRNRFIEHIL